MLAAVGMRRGGQLARMVARRRGLRGLVKGGEAIRLRIVSLVVGSIGLGGLSAVVVVRGESCILGGRGMFRGCRWVVGVVEPLVVRPRVPFLLLLLLMMMMA